MGIPDLYKDIQMVSETGWVICNGQTANGDRCGEGRRDGLWTLEI